MFTRYAVYWAPDPEGPLDRFASSWFGAAPDPWVAAPRRYGLHATLRAPFRPAEGLGRGDLEARLAALAASLPPVTTPPLTLHTGGRFLSLRPGGPAPLLDAMAAGVVRGSNDWRAPLTEAEIARRREAGLSNTQEAYLREWGYPHVFDEFRFHITLSGPLDGAQAAQAAEALRQRLPDLSSPFRITRLWLFGDPGGGAAFQRLMSFPLGG